MDQSEVSAINDLWWTA